MIIVPDDASSNGMLSKAEFLEFVKENRKDMDGLKEEIKRLTEELQQIRDSGPATEKSTSEADASKAKESGSSVNGDDAHDCLQPIAYEEAFIEIGGKEHLNEYTQLSRDLQASVNNDELQAELKDWLPEDYKERRGHSTKLLHQPFVPNINELYARANAVHFNDIVHTLAKGTGSKAIVPPIKSEVRAQMKALFKYRDRNAPNNNVAWYRLTDLVRATLEFSNINDMYGGLEKVVQGNEFGVDAIKEINDRYQHPLDGGYRDIQLVVCFKGHMCELQLSTEPMTRAKKTTGHRDFEVIRELEAAVEDGNLDRVKNALEFGREHHGSSKGAWKVALRELLRNSTLLHQAAERGHSGILHPFCCTVPIATRGMRTATLRFILQCLEDMKLASGFCVT